ncbi:indole-3-glycerol phosphate synthase TrpC [Clostridium estertheticum]|uniref:indole-3-glycerol phosphate synthase TrpC n=1 Tax=Clostridium estertheticum TaxID=238834 RepID=UPI001C0ACBD0|nr:indole-3-glycerol phosphate synthase TrpC [Clostridium estertheticum]MBU3218015.1 indole-3-glycerol phosphate synthase TrpC [Clostridium estertheticum]WAG55363.1 indole-3-glycerol phosphate synthase TrpC [Clostridium estertheticum]
MNILDEIVKNKILQIENEKIQKPLESLTNIEHRVIRNFGKALSKNGLSIIAEVKKASPSKGLIDPNFDPIKTALNYEKYGVDAISVLTEKKYFLGDDKNIGLVKKNTSMPILRKDFIIDKYQIYQSIALGADAILLIAAVLKDKLKSYFELATSLGLHCLVEVHNSFEIELALECGSKIIGINNRDLSNFHVDIHTTEKLMKYIPNDKIVVSESGISSIGDVLYLKSIGASAVLIGESFMRSPDSVETFLNACHD